MSRLGHYVVGYALAVGMALLALAIGVVLMLRPAALVAGVGYHVIPDRQKQITEQRLAYLRRTVQKRDRQLSMMGRKVRTERRAKRAWREKAHARPRLILPRTIYRAGLALLMAGYKVSEHPAFGGVDPVHTGGSKHYPPCSCAIDVNADGAPGGEMAALDRVAPYLRRAGFYVIWRSEGHYNHLHAQEA